MYSVNVLQDINTNAHAVRDVCSPHKSIFGATAIVDLAIYEEDYKD